jgi:hypothetical protein
LKPKKLNSDHVVGTESTNKIIRAILTVSPTPLAATHEKMHVMNEFERVYVEEKYSDGSQESTDRLHHYRKSSRIKCGSHPKKFNVNPNF